MSSFSSFCSQSAGRLVVPKARGKGKGKEKPPLMLYRVRIAAIEGIRGWTILQLIAVK